MGVRLKIKNPNLNIEERSYLDADYSSGTSLTVRDNDNFTANNFVVVGEPGQEQTEKDTVSSISGNTTIVVSTGLNFSHPKSSPVYESLWDQIELSRASSSGGTYSVVSTTNIEWDNRDLVTNVSDSAGASTDYYKWRFKNSATSSFSSYSGELPAGGLDEDTAGYVLSNIRENPISKGVSDKTIFKYLTKYNRWVYKKLPKAWWFLRQGDPVSTTADSYSFNIQTNWSDWKAAKYILYRYVSGSVDTTYPLYFKTELEMRNLKADANQNSTDPAEYWAWYPADSSSKKGYISIHPTPNTATNYVIPVYMIDLPEITSFSDTLIVPDTDGYENYVYFRIYKDILRDQENADISYKDVLGSLNALKVLSKKQHGQNEFRRYRGQRGFKKLFGYPSASYSDETRQNYW